MSAAEHKNTGRPRPLRRRNAKLAEDRNLPRLAHALDAARMKTAFQEFFAREYPAFGLQVESVNVGKVYHKPGKDCEIMYEVRGHDRENQAYAIGLQAKMAANGKARPEYLAGTPHTWPGCGFWRPVSIWPELDMVLYAFPYDRRLPYLGQLLEPEFVKQQVEAKLAAFGLPLNATCREVVCKKVKYMPGKRCVLRYEIVVADAANHQQQKVFYGKTYDNAQSRYVYEALRQISASPACATGELNVPAPIAHLDEANTVWQHAWEGENFDVAMMQKIGWENFGKTDFPDKIAAMLAALHQAPIAPATLRRGPALEMIIANACGDASDIAPFLPERRAELETIAAALETLAAGLEAPMPPATIHGSFKIAQLLCRNGPDGCRQFALVDFDSIACGDPLYDVAEFAASLSYLSVSDEIPAAAMAESVERFLAAYQKRVPWPCDRRRLAWYVAAFLLGKMHSSLKRRETKGAQNNPLAFSLVQEWLSIIRR